MAEDPNRDPSSPYKPGNVDENGNYKVGKYRAPEEHRFREGDGRRRGRRPKGQRNFDTEFAEEARRIVTVKEGGKERRVSKMRSAIIRAFDNAASKGNNAAIANLFQMAMRLSEKRAGGSSRLNAAEEALLDAWIDQQIAQRMAGDSPGDPETLEGTIADDHATDEEHLDD